MHHGMEIMNRSFKQPSDTTAIEDDVLVSINLEVLVFNASRNRPKIEIGNSAGTE